MYFKASVTRGIWLIAFFVAVMLPFCALAQTAPNFAQNRQLWDSGPDILALQQWLNQNGYPLAQSGTGSPGHETDTFGPETLQALKKFQNANGLSATGYLGPLTRAKIAALSSSSTSPVQTTESSSMSSPETLTLTRPLSLGDTGQDVSALQQFLKDQGFFSFPSITGYFGPVTQAAVEAFQSAHGVVSSGTPQTTGWGLVGPKTRAEIDTVSSAGASPSHSTVSTASPACSAPAGLSCIPGTSILQPLAPGNGYVPGFGGGKQSTSNSTPDSTPPSVSLTAPTSGSTVSGSSVTLTATATDDVAVQQVQFEADDADIGSAVTSSPYTTTWDSTGVADGTHTLYAVAEDTSGNYATSSISVTVRNRAPVISATSSATPTTTSATITWTTDEPATSLVNYGLTTGYGTASSSAALTTSHSITLTGLTAATTYDFQVESVDAEGNTATSSNQTLTTATNLVVDLNFASNAAVGCSSLTSCLSVTRTTTETCESPGSVVTYATPGNPCITSEGMQIYGAGTNLVPQSQTVTGWSAVNVTFAADGVVKAPDNSAAALTLTDNNTNGLHGVQRTISTVAGLNYIFSVFAKAGTCSGTTGECHIFSLRSAGTTGPSYVNFDASGCKVLASAGTSAAIIKVFQPKSFANGWCRFGFMATANTTGSANVQLFMVPYLSYGNASPSYVGGGSTLYVWGFDVKQQTVWTPYCPTTTGSATCNADVIKASNQLKTALEGSALRIVVQTAEFSESQPPQAAPIVGVGTALTGLGVAAGYQASTNWPTTATLNSAGQIIKFNNTNYIGLSADGSGRSLAMNGQTAVSDANGLSTSSTEYIGSLSDGSAYCNCVISDIKVWKTRDDAAMKKATANVNALPLIASYTGPVANHTRIPTNLIAAGSATQAMSRTHHRATENISAMQVLFANYYSWSESFPSADTTITASVEYPRGTCTPFTFSGSSSGTIPHGQSGNVATVLTDVLPISIPAGADFWIRDYRTNVGGIVDDSVPGPVDSGSGDSMHYGTSSISDQTTTCDAVPNTSPNNVYFPTAILGPTSLHSYCLWGDSRTQGTDDVPNDQGDALGELERWLVPYYSVLNMGIGGQGATTAITNNTNRLAMLAYCTGMFVDLGVNDIYFFGKSATTTEANLATIYGYSSRLHGDSGPVWQTTIMAETTSSDNWATTANQTPVTGSSELNTLNGWIRSNTAGITGYFENANVVSTSQNSDIWCANGSAFGCTIDGTHPSQQGYNMIQNGHSFPVLK